MSAARGGQRCHVSAFKLPVSFDPEPSPLEDISRGPWTRAQSCGGLHWTVPKSQGLLPAENPPSHSRIQAPSLSSREKGRERCFPTHPHPRVPRGDPCTWSPPTPGRLENEAARALEEESPGRTPAVSDTISTQSLSKVVKLGLQLEWPVNPELNTFNGGSRHLGNIHRPINTSLDITLCETLHSPGKQ